MDEIVPVWQTVLGPISVSSDREKPMALLRSLGNHL